VTILFTLMGIALILAVLRDVFRTLFPYTEKITVSRVVVKVLWRGLHRLGVRRPQVLYAAGANTTRSACNATRVASKRAALRKSTWRVPRPGETGVASYSQWRRKP
jgi:hypothetical protein